MSILQMGWKPLWIPQTHSFHSSLPSHTLSLFNGGQLAKKNPPKSPVRTSDFGTPKISKISSELNPPLTSHISCIESPSLCFLILMRNGKDLKSPKKSFRVHHSFRRYYRRRLVLRPRHLPPPSTFPLTLSYSVLGIPSLSLSLSLSLSRKMASVGLSVWFRNKIVDPLLQILRRGAEPKLLASSAALGITLGVFPICGITVFLCGMAIAVLGSRCHAPTVMLANFIATPIELSLVVPFLRFGEVISGGSHFPLTSDALKKVLTGQASHDVLLSIAHALLGWLVAAPFILVALCILFLPCFKILVRKFSVIPSSPKKPVHSHSELKLKGGQYMSLAGERGDTDNEDLLAGLQKTLILKGSVEYGSKNLHHSEDGYKKEDIVPQESHNIQ